ncbi:hypothetical protein [Paenilisteria weihenstephanensis]|uniref:hypothetical protein n=1 Tax=Listeria weihenstephanensis TaxID=1006155 RepID=UPI00131F1841|nr:hypothetical protein [Listeria weihenstephanensis]
MKILVIGVYVILVLAMLVALVFGWASDRVFSISLVVIVLYGIFMRFYLKRTKT